MRYNDWDVCLYSREDCMPLREFKTECLTVPYLDENDSQQSSSHDDGFFPHRKMPTVTTHVPSLAPGAPFCVNINRWMPAFRSKPTDASDRIVIRVLIDGTLAAQSMRAEDASWPYDVDHALGPNKPGIAMPLRFPTFRKEFLRKNERLDLGCITVVITEWSPREQKTVVFSFRYAPIDILETSRIAWPNPAMWCDDVAAIGPPSPPSHEPKDCEQQSANSKHLGAATNLPSPTTISYSGCVFNWPGSVPQHRGPAE
ncbi:hypothetical protein Cob_v001438 [Colletotrichum orbiculare MAFF 240422]|uniref:Uncharacterized protein n=1 Tax=Colletotrichum orbiculare (strain 104-T / ATCC 96160 / CBS 514.97 / LARS 414 / MAFF 240422) TaxID=1213857 RepID=A0A484G985_COLOR|nr:hypothetical protein Cob_v001438 [Colletotrichum orbiculare MAFF 240422]